MNYKKIVIYLIGIVIGITLIYSSIHHMYFEQTRAMMSDETVKSRARDLGMIELTEALGSEKSADSEDKNKAK